MGRTEIGEISGKLTIMGRANPPRNKSGRSLYDVKCGWCGKTRAMRADHFRRLKSCGCASVRLNSEARTQHGASKDRKMTPEFKAWVAAKQRCYNKKDGKYHRYGSRGIEMCKEWLHDFPAFLDHIGPRPSSVDTRNPYSLDRIDNDGDYEPGNVRWATAKQQSRNRMNNRVIKFNGEALCVTEWSERLGIQANTLWMRLNHYGWSIERALTQPARIWGR